ncbi:acyltransferase family protein [Pontibacter aydingkolensis]|uniref:Acyltransferase family protein n=2 Tax=Pontibacter aydingkolensis TaxID=1911536 RepID=A0ABS7CYT4_9BACT|nr:acyltransferase family protein [Pontibacter aydingkolensis]
MHFQQIDVLKGVAILAVISLHSATKHELVQTYAIYHIWQAVPVFMVLMGLNLGLGLKPGYVTFNAIYSRSYFTKKATRILFPFLLIFIMSVLLGILWLQLFSQDVMQFSKYTLIGVLPVSGKGNYFITLLLQSILVLPLVGYSFVKRPVLTTLVLVTLELLFLVMSKHYNLFESEGGEYVYSAALPRYFSALAYGLWLSKAIKQSFKPAVLAAFLAPGILSIVYLYLIIYGPLHIPVIYATWDMQNVLAFGYAALLILLFVYLLPGSSYNFTLKTLAQLGQASYHIFLVQVLYFGLTTEHSNLLLNLAVCVTLGYLFYRLETPLSKKYLSIT